MQSFYSVFKQLESKLVNKEPQPSAFHVTVKISAMYTMVSNHHKK